MTYLEWIARYDTLTPERRECLLRDLKQLTRPPLISILLPVYNPDLHFLNEALASVRQQVYQNWQLCIADDASTNSLVRSFLEEQARNDSRIKLLFRDRNGHISACSNSTLTLAGGEWCALFDQDDLLAQNALAEIASEAASHPQAAVIYSDEDFIDSVGVRTNPFFKPDWNAELFLGQNYLNHLGVYRTELLREIGGFREGFEGSQDYDLALRCVARLEAAQIRHIPRILYHWRMAEGSLASEPDAKPYARHAARRAINSYCAGQGIEAHAVPCPENDESHRVIYESPSQLPKVAIITPSQHISDWIAGTDYPAIELLLSASNARELNKTAFASSAAVFVFLTGPVAADDTAWLRELVSHVMRVDVGAVGARLWLREGCLEDGARVLGLGKIASPAFCGIPRGHPGYFNRAWLQQSCSAVSIACLAVRREVFQALNGFDVTNLPNHFFDIDFCLRLRDSGLHVIWTPYANLITTGMLSHEEDTATEESYLRARWDDRFQHDRFYNPNLSLKAPGFVLAEPPRLIERTFGSPQLL